MDLDPTSNATVLSRCHRCEWIYEAEDSEFPSRFVFDVAYQVCSGVVVVRAFEPKYVVTMDCRGAPLFVHEFAVSEQGDIGRWFERRFQSQRDLLMDELSAEIEDDRESRHESASEAFRELIQWRCRTSA